MRIGILFVLIILSIICNGQDIDSTSADVIEFNEINNYVPKSLLDDTVVVLSIGKTHLGLNSIAGLYIYFIFQDDYNLNISDIKILENRVKVLARALFNENRFVMIKKVGGYVGCTGKMLSREKQNGIEVIVLKYCYSCTDFTLYADKFIEIYNSEMTKLMCK